MSRPDAGLLRASLPPQVLSALDVLETFDSIGSTNSYLLEEPPPAPGRFRVALANHQSEGRGRHAKRWVAPPGSGICLSFARVFNERIAELPALTLALGVGVVEALAGLGIRGIGLKWPNDVVALDGKLAGILTETSVGAEGVTVVAGIGMNLRFPVGVDTGIEPGWALPPVDLARAALVQPAREEIAAAIVAGFHMAMSDFAKHGFAAFAGRWGENDWLHGRSIVVDEGMRERRGTAAGVDNDGALLLETDAGRERVIAGSISLDAGAAP